MSAFYDLSKTPRNILNQAIVRSIVSENNGLLFDPSDLSTLFQDAAGTTPVTAVEQPVGLMLDKSRGLMLGPELVDGALWGGLATGVTYSNGNFTLTAATSTLLAANSFIIKGKYYQVSFTLQSISTGSLSLTLEGGAATTPTYTTAGTYTVRICATASGNLFLYNRSASTTATVSNISCKELYGNHATQSITASRPTLSARYNLLTKTEDFSDAVWTKIGAGVASAPVVTNNYGTSPDGTQTACRVQMALNGGTTTTDRSCLLQQPPTISGTNYASTFWVKSNTAQSYVVQQRLGLSAQNITIDQTWRAYTYSQLMAADPTHWIALRGAQGTSDSADILIWHPQLNIGTTSGPYQRVNTATDYDTDPRYFPKYLRFDGIDDYMNLPYMGIYSGGAASIICARDAVSQATDTYIISERSTTDIDPKYFPSRQLANAGNMDAYISDDAGTAVLDTVGSPFSGVANAVIRSIVDSGNNLKLFKNGVLAANDNYTRSGTLTLNNTTIGASVSTTTSNYASMKLYGLIVTKSALTDAQRIKCERYAASKAGVTL